MAELTQEQIAAVKHQATAEEDHLVLALVQAHEERGREIERLREALGELLTHIRKRGHEDLPHPIWDAVYKADAALAASPEPVPPEALKTDWYYRRPGVALRYIADGTTTSPSTSPEPVPPEEKP